MPPQYRVLITDRAWPDCRIEREIFTPAGARVIEPPDTSEKTLIELAQNVDAIGTCWAQVTPAVVETAPKCRGIARFGIGLDNIAVETATERKIPVTYVPDYCISEVSDHALALLLACARQIAFFHHQAKQGHYDRQTAHPMRRLSGQTVGLLGLGRIARQLVPKLRALGLNVMAHTSSGNDYGTGVSMVGFDQLLKESDYLSLHLPLSESTYHLFGLSEFRRMKPSAYLINTARGPLIDHRALSESLKDEEIAGAALDVFEPEPPDLSEQLFRDPRVIVSPHAAFLSEESVQELRTRASRQILSFLQGERPENVVNPQIFTDRHE